MEDPSILKPWLKVVWTIINDTYATQSMGLIQQSFCILEYLEYNKSWIKIIVDKAVIVFKQLFCQKQPWDFLTLLRKFWKRPPLWYGRL